MKSTFLKNLRASCVKWLTKEVESPRKLPLTDFERIQYEIRPCDVLLVEGRTRISHAISLITQSSWSHAALYVGRLHDIADRSLRERITQFYHGEPEDQLLVESFLGKGIIVSPITKYKNDHIRICRPKGISRQDSQQVIAYAINRLGLHYDIRNIFDLTRLLLPWAIMPRRWRSSLFYNHPGPSTKETCSALIAEAFQNVDFPILPVMNIAKKGQVELVQRIPRLFTPSDFDYSPFFEIIKYPIIELESGTYRKLPWNKEGLLADSDGRLYGPGLDKKLIPAKEKPLSEDEKKEPPRNYEFFD